MLTNVSFSKKNSKRIKTLVALSMVFIFSGLSMYFYYGGKSRVKDSFGGTEIKNDDQQKPPEELVDPLLRDFGLKIDKIGVTVPVIKNVDGKDKSSYNKALEGGVAHYEGTALPGEGSNVFIFGHSSSVLGAGKYDKIFAKLGEIEKEDTIVLYYSSKKYTYQVKEKKVVSKNDNSVLKQIPEEQLTLMTCWPVGTNSKRLIIVAFPID